MAERPEAAEILDNLYDGVYFVDRDRTITYWNRGAERITGYAADEVIGRRCRDNLLNHVDETGRLLCFDACPLVATMRDGDPREADVFLHHAHGHRVPVLVRCSPVRDDDGTIVGAVESFTSELGVRSTRAALKELRREVRTDLLTGIGNRAYLEGRLRGLVAEYRDLPGEAAVAMIDVDHFKRVNDRFGHPVGDRVLRMIAATLQTNVRATDSVGRWGGEEFLVVFDGVHELAELRRLSEKLRSLVARSALELDEGPVHVTISVGATLLRQGDTPETIVGRADELLYESKRGGRDRVTVD